MNDKKDFLGIFRWNQIIFCFHGGGIRSPFGYTYFGKLKFGRNDFIWFDTFLWIFLEFSKLKEIFTHCNKKIYGIIQYYHRNNNDQKGLIFIKSHSRVYLLWNLFPCPQNFSISEKIHPWNYLKYVYGIILKIFFLVRL